MAKALSQITLDFGMPETPSNTPETPEVKKDDARTESPVSDDEAFAMNNDAALVADDDVFAVNNDAALVANDDVFAVDDDAAAIAGDEAFAVNDNAASATGHEPVGPVPADYQVEFAIEEGKVAMDSISVTNEFAGPAVFFEEEEEVAPEAAHQAIDDSAEGAHIGSNEDEQGESGQTHQANQSGQEDEPGQVNNTSQVTTAKTTRELPAPRPYSGRGRRPLRDLSGPADYPEMPGDDVLFSKQYYSMKDLAAMFRENQSLIRYWETEFDILQPKKNAKGDRFFRPVDVKNLFLIYDLLRRRKFTIEGAKEYLKGNKKAEERFEMIRSLSRIRQFLLELKADL